MRGMERVDGTLADGREIFWFDPDGTGRSAALDRRELGPHDAGATVRYDPLSGEWIALAAHRQSRTFMPSASECPLCPTRPGSLSEVPSADYNLVAFENRFPSFGGAGGSLPDRPDGLEREQAAVGRCEVLCFSSDHTGSFADLTRAQARLVVDAWADRTAALSALPQVEYVFPFENRGAEIGVTLQHPHGQIYGYPYIPPRVRTELASARRHREATSRDLFADIIESEDAGPRVVAADDHWLAFVPYAARWPMEVHMYPRRKVADLTGLSGAERDSFAVMYLRILRGFDRLYDSRLPYIAGWHQAPSRIDRDLAWLHLEAFSIRRSADKLKFLAGSESAQGAFIGDVAPEEQADRLRAVMS